MEDRENKLKLVESEIEIVRDFPKPGIFFYDIFPVLRKPDLLNYLVELLYDFIKNSILKDEKIDYLIALDARGFLLGPILALKLNCGFVPIRKKGKLPGLCYSYTYDLEYGNDTLEIQKDSIKPGSRVLLFDDVVATGGSLEASVHLIQSCGASNISAVVLIELTDLNGKNKVNQLNVPVFSLLQRP